MPFPVEEENESRVFASLHVCTKAVIMLYYNCQLCFVSVASHYSPSFIKFGKYRQGQCMWAEELTTFKCPCGWIIAAMKHPWVRPDVALSRRVGGRSKKGFQEPTQRFNSCCTCIQTVTHSWFPKDFFFLVWKQRLTLPWSGTQVEPCWF